MFVLPEDQVTALGVIAGVVSALVIVCGLPLAWRNYLINELTNNATRRERLGRALAVSRILDGYRWAVGGGLDKLDQWMGGYGDLARGYSWCTSAAITYAAASFLMPWLLFGLGTDLGEATVFPAATSAHPSWLRFSLFAGVVVIILAAALAPSYFKIFRRATEQSAQKCALNRFVRWPILIIISIAFYLFAFFFYLWSVQTAIILVPDSTIVIAAILGIIAALLPLLFQNDLLFLLVFAIITVIFSFFAVTLCTFLFGEFASFFGVVVLCIFVGAMSFRHREIIYIAPIVVAASLLYQVVMKHGPGSFGAVWLNLFIYILPLPNALLDLLSWLVSRWLGRDLLKKLDGRRLAQVLHFSGTGWSTYFLPASFSSPLQH